jgi:hypothetical protein
MKFHFVIPYPDVSFASYVLKTRVYGRLLLTMCLSFLFERGGGKNDQCQYQCLCQSGLGAIANRVKSEKRVDI